ncbi:acyl-CoA dehydrogenase, partial [Mycobacteroides abscessus subsp. abscessus]|nr:acyl-CoA dehydrogenase [Mycobacteroides abscessus subsp. abscessus]
MTTSITLVAPRRFDIVDTVEAALGDARDPDNPAGFAVLAAQDRDDTFPADAIAILDRLRVAEHYVPVADGGRLAD